jgi:hypothetical protein
VEGFTSPRSWAFALLGLHDYCAAKPDDGAAEQTRVLLANRLMAILAATATDDWIWFENGLSYDNARLCQALLVTGKAMGVRTYVAAGLRTLGWLTAHQTVPEGHFRPVGSDSFADHRMVPRAFDQQPLEAAAAISACVAAYESDGTVDWKDAAERAFAWFMGENDLRVALVDVESGSCRDGLHPDRANENRGGESVLAYLLSLAEMRRFAGEVDDRAKRAPPPLSLVRA